MSYAGQPFNPADHQQQQVQQAQQARPLRPQMRPAPSAMQQQQQQYQQGPPRPGGFAPTMPHRTMSTAGVAGSPRPMPPGGAFQSRPGFSPLQGSVGRPQMAPGSTQNQQQQQQAVVRGSPLAPQPTGSPLVRPVQSPLHQQQHQQQQQQYGAPRPLPSSQPTPPPHAQIGASPSPRPPQFAPRPGMSSSPAPGASPRTGPTAVSPQQQPQQYQQQPPAGFRPPGAPGFASGPDGPRSRYFSDVSHRPQMPPGGSPVVNGSLRPPVTGGPQQPIQSRFGPIPPRPGMIPGARPMPPGASPSPSPSPSPAVTPSVDPNAASAAAPMARSETMHMGGGAAAARRRMMYPGYAQAAYERGTDAASTAAIAASRGMAGSPSPAPPSQQQQHQPASSSAAQSPGEFFIPGETPSTAATASMTPADNVSPLQAGVSSSMGSVAMAPSATMPVSSLASQMGQMSIGQPSSAVSATSVSALHGAPPIAEMTEPAPAIILPPNSCVGSKGVVTCPSEYMRCTMNVLPDSDKLCKKTGVPFGVIMTPYRTASSTEEPIPVSHQIIRCRKCRTYLNPYIKYVDGGRKWRCNMCNLNNDLPRDFEYDRVTQQPLDRYSRPECNNCVVEFIAPSEYLVRAPTPPVYLFVIDSSFASISSGLIEYAARAIKESLDVIPNSDGRTCVGFITVDASLHFYYLNESFDDPQMIVVSELDDIMLPMPNGLIVNLNQNRTVIESLLNKLPSLFTANHSVSNSLGSALNYAAELISGTGGKIIVLQASLPDKGSGALKLRDHSKVIGTANESVLLQSANDFYKNFATTCIKSQISVDLMAFGSNAADLATLSGLSKHTGGNIFHYPDLSPGKPSIGKKFVRELKEYLSYNNGSDAVLRLRMSKGISSAAYYGHFFLRSMDLLALPSVTPNQSYAVDLEYSDNLSEQVAYLQSALLYTTNSGERRIRVTTMALPVSSSISNVFHSVDQKAVVTLLAKKAVDRALTSKIDDAREAVLYKCIEILGNYKKEVLGKTPGNGPVQLQAPRNLHLLPLLTLGLLKHPALRDNSGGGHPILPDSRIYSMAQLTTRPPEIILSMLAPRMYALHSLTTADGVPDENNGGRISLPSQINPCSEWLQRNGAFLLDSADSTFLWVGRDAHPQLLRDVLGCPAFDSLPADPQEGALDSLPVLETAASRQVRAILDALRDVDRNVFKPAIQIVREGQTSNEPRAAFIQLMVEDRTQKSQSYIQFLTEVREAVNKGKY
ncbi:hypothetical protein GQ42DRAFT_164737 [Ramicandelaber brevisporus]|nr:hypothetical protein GQ42DRAFT_164737 [Ramicandelaber brevisporus]